MTGQSQSYMHDWLSALCGGGWTLSFFSRFCDSMSQTHPVSSGLSSTVGSRIFTWSSHSSCWKGRLSQKTSVSNCCLVTRVEWAPTIEGLLLLNRGLQTHPVLSGLSSTLGLRIGTLAGKVVSLLRRGHELAHVWCGQRNCLCSVPNGGLCVVVPRVFYCCLVT